MASFPDKKISLSNHRPTSDAAFVGMIYWLWRVGRVAAPGIVEPKVGAAARWPAVGQNPG